jgi:small subunit ribosomal protein S20
MANHKSAEKQHRHAERRRVINRRNRTRLRTAVKRLRQAVASADKNAAAMLSSTESVVDKAVKLGAIHWRRAARTKSRLAKAVKRLA